MHQTEGVDSLGFIDAIKKGFSGPEPASYKIADRVVTCPHCGGQTFTEGSALLNTSGMTFLELDWANREASLLLCATCSRIEWFIDAPEQV